MKLYIETMDAVLVEFDADGNVRLDGEDWRRPTLQERRAVIHAARSEMEDLSELITALETD